MTYPFKKSSYSATFTELGSCRSCSGAWASEMFFIKTTSSRGFNSFVICATLSMLDHGLLLYYKADVSNGRYSACRLTRDKVVGRFPNQAFGLEQSRSPLRVAII